MPSCSLLHTHYPHTPPPRGLCCSHVGTCGTRHLHLSVSTLRPLAAIPGLVYTLCPLHHTPHDIPTRAFPYASPPPALYSIALTPHPAPSPSLRVYCLHVGTPCCLLYSGRRQAKNTISTQQQLSIIDRNKQRGSLYPRLTCG